MAVASSPWHLKPFASPTKTPATSVCRSPPPPRGGCQGSDLVLHQAHCLIKEKAKRDAEDIFLGFSKTRENLAVIAELLIYWNLSDAERVLDKLEEGKLHKSNF